MRRCVLAVLAILLLLTACAPRRYDESNIDKRYDRDWIIGKSQTEITRRYGEFERIYEQNLGYRGAYYVNYDHLGMDPSYVHDTYFIEFDENGIAVNAYFVQTSIGG